MSVPPQVIAGQSQITAVLFNALLTEVQSLGGRVTALESRVDPLEMILRVAVVAVVIKPLPAVGEDPLPSTVTYTVRPKGAAIDGSLDVAGVRPWIGGYVANDSVGIVPAVVGQRGLLVRFPRANQDGPAGGVWDTALILPESINFVECL